MVSSVCLGIRITRFWRSWLLIRIFWFWEEGFRSDGIFVCDSLAVTLWKHHRRGQSCGCASIRWNEVGFLHDFQRMYPVSIVFKLIRREVGSGPSLHGWSKHRRSLFRWCFWVCKFLDVEVVIYLFFIVDFICVEVLSSIEGPWYDWGRYPDDKFKANNVEYQLVDALDGGTIFFVYSSASIHTDFTTTRALILVIHRKARRTLRRTSWTG